LAIVLGNRSLRQIEGSEGRETGRSLALAGVIWGWAAIGLTVLILLIILGVNGARVTEDDVRQQVANLAFAERYYYEEHGEFTSDLDKLNPVRVSRVNIGVFIDSSGQSFCVTAWGGDHERAATYDSAFTSDGEHVKLWSDRGCKGTSQRPPPV
jgi:hypothetical protein